MNQREGDYVPIRDAENIQLGMFDKPLPSFGCGIGWFSEVLFYLPLPIVLSHIDVPFRAASYLDLCSYSSLMDVPFLYSLVLGFVFPLMWYFSAILYFGKYYNKDPREQYGLAACAIVAILFTIATVIALLVYLL